MSRSESALSETQKQLDALASEIRPQWLEGWYDGLGYCKCPGVFQNNDLDLL